jgi:hypothetical protein
MFSASNKISSFRAQRETRLNALPMTFEIPCRAALWNDSAIYQALVGDQSRRLDIAPLIGPDTLEGAPLLAYRLQQRRSLKG